MDTQKLKGIIILVIIVAVIVGTTLFVSINVITPKMRDQIKTEEMKKIADEQDMRSVVVASQDIPMGSLITENNLQVKSVPGANAVVQEKLAKSTSDVVGKIAKTNIFANEQITVDKIGFTGQMAKEDIEKLNSLEPEDLEQTDRYITVDIPRYNFVNGAVTKGSLVDILLDKGKGKYEVVLSKVIIHEKKEIGEASGKDSAEDVQPKNQQRLTPVLDTNNGGSVPGVDAGKIDPLKDQSNPAFIDTTDFRVTLKVNELEHKRLFQAMTEGKLMTRLYVLPSQDESIETYNSSEENYTRGIYNSVLQALDKKVQALKLKNKTLEKEDQKLYDRLDRLREDFGLVKKPEESKNSKINNNSVPD